jgi:ribosomal protein S12 methylthiotransferase
MGRGMTRAETLALLDRVAAKLSRGALRTTFIVGYPNETDADFEQLLSLVREGRFAHVGVFAYSQEPGTPAAQIEDNVPAAEKTRRRNALMEAQRDVSRGRLRKRVGQTVEVMVDGPASAGRTGVAGVRAVGRSRLEAPEVDGVILLKGSSLRGIAPGTVLRARIVDSLDYDLVAETQPGRS